MPVVTFSIPADFPPRLESRIRNMSRSAGREAAMKRTKKTTPSTSPLIYIGLDPGISGAIAFVTKVGLLSVHDMPTMKLGKSNRVNAASLSSLLQMKTGPSRFEGRYHAVIERVGAMPSRGAGSMPKQGAAGTFSFGHSAGVLEGVLAALSIPYELVTPQVWKRHFRLLGAEKEASRAKAIQLYPTAPLDRKKDVGRAEAILLARYIIDERS